MRKPTIDAITAPEVRRSPGMIFFSIPTMHRYVREVIDLSSDFMEDNGVFDNLGTIVVLRELLTNAIYHGNRNVTERKVAVQIEMIDTAHIKIKVQDEGEGFDYASLAIKIPEDPRRYVRRGYTLIHALSDRIEFNEKGNCTTVYISAR